MSKVLIWNQGGVKNVIFSHHIIFIQQNSTNPDYSDITVREIDKPIVVPMTVNKILTALKIPISQ